MTNNIKILILCNSNFKINDILTHIKKYNYETVMVSDSEKLFMSIKNITPSVIIIHDELTGEFTEDILIDIRKFTEIPIVVLSDEDDINYKLICYSIGIDEFLGTKTDPRENAARINAVIRRIRRANISSADEIMYDNLYINISSYEIIVSGITYKLPPKETELLYFLAKNPNKVFTREQLLDQVWGYDYFGDSRTVDVHIKKLRKHFTFDNSIWKIETVWGVGYKFRVS